MNYFTINATRSHSNATRSHRGFAAIAIAIALIIAGLSLVGCPEESDTTPPAQVAGLAQMRAAGSTSIILSWENPPDTDLRNIRIAWTPESSGQPQPIEISFRATGRTGGDAVVTKRIPNLDPDTEYTFTILTVDRAGNTSDSSSAPTVTAETGAIDFTAIGAGVAHTCTLRGDAVSCWGSRMDGRLGDGGATTGNQPTPVAVALAEVSALSVGSTHTCAIAGDAIAGANDTAYCWGDGANGRLGNGVTSGDQSAPVAISQHRWRSWGQSAPLVLSLVSPPLSSVPPIPAQ